MNRLGYLAICGATAFAAILSTSAAHAQSAKFAAQVSNMELVPSVVCSSTDVQVGACAAPQWSTVLQTSIKTPNQKDLLIDGSLQSGILTNTLVASKGGARSTSTASATINVRILIDGQPATVCTTNCAGGVAYPPQVTYNARTQQLSAQLNGLNCTAGLTTGAVTCTDPETIGLLLDTTSANSFNFVAPNLTAGSHTVELQVNIGESASSDTIGAGANVVAEVGVGTLTVQQVQATNTPNGITFTN